MNAIFDIPYNFQFSVKFSTHMINSTRKKTGLNCTNNSLNKFHFHSFRNKIINLVLVIKYHFDFRLQFNVNEKMHIPELYRNLV